MASLRRGASRTAGARGKGEMEEEEEAAAATATTTTRARNPPHLPTPLERAVLALFPAVLAFGTVFSLVSPETRAAPYDAASQAHAQDAAAAPSYFARKSNLFNVVFVKRGWGWTTLAFVVFLATHPGYGGGGGGGWEATPRRARAALRWAAVTAWWFLFTQWCLGPPVIDRGFRWTGGRCEVARRELDGGGGGVGVGEALTAVACKAAGGQWKGGHDISGHVFLLVLGTVFLMHEVGWPVLRLSGAWRDERCVVMADGAVKGASVEAGPDRPPRPAPADLPSALGPSGKLVVAVAGLKLWMLLMTAIYFHTWFEKLTGLLAALLGWYAVYVVPRFVPALRAVVGLPGI